jgi:SAM-dependent methyltransferase
MNKANYGLDAPYAIRNLIIAGIVSLIFIPLLFYIPIISQSTLITILVIISLLLLSASFLMPAILMIITSKIGKIKQRNRILDQLHLQGHDLVLDVGCGRGLFLIGVAKRLTTGKAVGIDIWTTDLSDNTKEALLMNARIENVSDKIEVYDADARRMPFADNAFDIVVSSMVIHNIPNKSEREKALQEMLRVIKSNGRIVIQDFQCIDEYVAFFKAHNCTVDLSKKQWIMFPPTQVVWAVKKLV